LHPMEVKMFRRVDLPARVLGGCYSGTPAG
jgi:hypothetical protein